MSRMEEIKAKCENVTTAGLLDGDPYDDVKEYIETLESALAESQKELFNMSYVKALAAESTAELKKYRAAEQGGQLVVLPIGYMHGRITDQYAKYNLHSIHDICYAGFDGTCEMPHCSGCPIRKMYMIMQDIENQAEAVQKERERQ